MNESNMYHWSSYYLQKKRILIIVIALISMFFVFLFTRDIPSRLANGNRGLIAIKTLDEVRRPFLDIYEVESLLLTYSYNKTIHESFEHALNCGLHLIADFKTAAAYNPALLERVEKLANTFEEWINNERVLIAQLERNNQAHNDSLDDVEGLNILAVTSRYFSLTMGILGDAEVPIHKDIHEGSKAEVELIISGGVLLFCFICMVFFLQWFKNKELKGIIKVNKETEARFASMAYILEESLNEIYIFDSKTLRFLKVNKGARLNLGYSVEELSRLTPIDLIPGFTAESFEKMVEPLRTGKKEKIQFTAVHRRKDGSLYDVEVHLQLSTFQSVPAFVAIILDITERKQAEDKMRKFSHAVDYGSAAVVITDIEGNIEYANTKFVQLTGYSLEEAIGKNPRVLKSGKTSPEVYRELWETITSGCEWRGEFCNKKKNGELYWESASISPVKDDKGVITNFIAIKDNITEYKQAEEKIKKLNETLEQHVLTRTIELGKKIEELNAEVIERKRIEKALRESEEKYRAVFEQASNSIVVVDADTGKIIEFNTSAHENLGYTRKEFEKLKVADIDVIESHEDIMNHIEHIMKYGEDDFETKHVTKKGEIRDMLISAKIISIPGRKTFSSIWNDITERKQAEEDLCKKNSYLNLLKVTAVAANESEDVKDAFLPILEEICRYTGWEIGHAYTISKDDPDLLEPTEVWWLENSKQFEKFCSVSKNIKFAKGIGLPGRVLADSKPHWIVDVTKDKNFLRTKIASDMNIRSGIAFPVMVGTKVVAVLSFFTTKALEPDKQLMEIMAEVGTQLGRTVERKQAKYVLEKNFLDQKILNDLLKISHEENTLMELLEHAIDTILGMSWLTSKMGAIFMVETEPEVLVLKVRRNLPKRLLEVCNLVPFGMCLCGKAALSGKIIHSETIDEDHVISYKGIESHGHYNVPILLDGKTIGVILLYLNAGHSRDENEVMFLETLANTLSGIIKRKKMEEALVQSEKMKAMGIMTSGVAHEFNNILATISGTAQVLEVTNKSDKELLKSLRIICRMTDDGAEIVDRMYEFTNVHRDVSRYVNVDLNDLIKQVIGFTMPRWKEMAQAEGRKYQIVRKGAKALPSVLGNPSELREVLLNIINNALDAMPDGGTITVETRCVRSSVSARPDKPFGQGVRRKEEIVSELPARSADGRTQNSDLKSDFVKITFADTGKGMSDEVKKMMFDPFFTTRGPQGTGLGMSVSYGIIMRHGGEISVESELGRGSKINLNLPVAGKSIPYVAVSKKIEEIKIKSLNILVVDDQEEICDSLSKIFIEEGHKVCSVISGAEAVKLLKKNNYDLLICDLVMPDVNGKDVIKVVDTLNKRPKVALITGWRYKMENAKNDGLKVDFIIKKPFDLSKLRRDINSAFK